MRGGHASFFLNMPTDSISNGADLCVGIPLTYNEIIGGGVIQVSEVKLDDILAFDILYAIYD